MCASLDRFNILGLRDQNKLWKENLIWKIWQFLWQNVAKLAIFYGKICQFLWQNLAKFRISNGNFLRCQISIDIEKWMLLLTFSVQYRWRCNLIYNKTWYSIILETLLHRTVFLSIFPHFLHQYFLLVKRF